MALGDFSFRFRAANSLFSKLRFFPVSRRSISKKDSEDRPLTRTGARHLSPCAAKATRGGGRLQCHGWPRAPQHRYYPITKLNSGWINFITIDVHTSLPRGSHSSRAPSMGVGTINHPLIYGQCYPPIYCQIWLVWRKLSVIIWRCNEGNDRTDEFLVDKTVQLNAGWSA